MQVLSANALENRTRRSTWSWASLRGELVELTANGPGANLSFAASLVYEAQRAQEPVAWIASYVSTFFPPDMADAGVDLSAMPVVRTRSGHEAMYAADKLLRTGSFGLVVIDLGEDERIPSALIGRVQKLAVRHDALVLCLLEKPEQAASLGAATSLRAEARRYERKSWRFRCTLRVLKDKRHAPGWSHESHFLPPAGFY